MPLSFVMTDWTFTENQNRCFASLESFFPCTCKLTEKEIQALLKITASFDTFPSRTRENKPLSSIAWQSLFNLRRGESIQNSACSFKFSKIELQVTTGKSWAIGSSEIHSSCVQTEEPWILSSISMEWGLGGSGTHSPTVFFQVSQRRFWC